MCVAAPTTPHSRALQPLCRVVARFMLPLVAVHRRACTSSHWKLSLYSRHWRTDCAIPTPCLNGVVPVVSGLDADIRDAHVRRKPHEDAIWRRAQMHRIAHHNEQSRYIVSMSVSHLPMCTSLDTVEVCIIRSFDGCRLAHHNEHKRGRPFARCFTLSFRATDAETIWRRSQMCRLAHHNEHACYLIWKYRLITAIMQALTHAILACSDDLETLPDASPGSP